jgi:hypothetical protein
MNEDTTRNSIQTTRIATSGVSGSQIIAAAKIGRRSYAMELQPAFVDVARRRWTGYARSAGIDPGPGALE